MKRGRAAGEGRHGRPAWGRWRAGPQTWHRLAEFSRDLREAVLAGGITVSIRLWRRPRAAGRAVLRRAGSAGPGGPGECAGTRWQWPAGLASRQYRTVFCWLLHEVSAA